MFADFRRDVGRIIKGAIKSVYFMRGAVSYEEVMLMSYAERSLVDEFIAERLEAEGKKQYPVY